MQGEVCYYVKSFSDDFKLRTTDKTKTQVSQTIAGIFRRQCILPNTLSFGMEEKRLCTTILDKNYTETYRPQGIIFHVVGEQKPDYVFPFDLNAITDNNTPVANYSELVQVDKGARLIKEYNHKLIDGFLMFMRHSYSELVETFKDESGHIDPKKMLVIVNEFRVSKGYMPLDASNERLVGYNEAIFLRPVEVKIVALYGDTSNAYYRQLSAKYSVPLYATAKDFYLSKNS